MISAAKDLADYGSLVRVLGEPVATADAAFLDYLRRMLAEERAERLLGIFLDKSERFVCAEWLGHGQEDEVLLDCRSVITRMIQLGASGLILAHNHPTGELRASHADKRSTARLKSLLAVLDCELRDHLIVGRDGCLSMARAGLL